MELAPGDARFAKLAKELDDKAPPKAAAAPPAASEDQGSSELREAQVQARLLQRRERGGGDGVRQERAGGARVRGLRRADAELLRRGPRRGAVPPPATAVGRKVVPAKCRYSILPSKIEVRLAKADEQVTWTSLEYTSKANNKLAATATTTTRKKVDWDKLEAEVKKEEEEEEVDTATPVVNRFFQQMYGNGDEDMRRAIMKSYVESYVLSTDWKDVGSKKIEASAPEGMELHKWEY
ncbi:hypothetical protein OsJ_01984 [Oryza sativa Japonica Group]|uniref:SGS domain-containing protein n=1 Tax=Oryza sativa subsp. japonica TaxID=39947 RepID=B9EX66_ORYSJ|nr:hypothetical protein OsJ_01984 [Oryza sativa Japonica Group]